MRIIETIPLTKIPLPNTQILTYFTNKVSIKQGSLVMAPLGKRKTPAIVINSRLLEDEKMSIRKADFQLSPIKEILSAKPVISPKQLELAFWIHNYYYESLGLILKSMLPHNIDSNYKLQITNYKKISISKFQILSLREMSRRDTNLLQSDIKNGIHYFQKEIEKTLEKKRQILILAPEINILDYLQKELTPLISPIAKRETATITSRVSPKQFQEIWKKTAQGKIKIIFGARKALFLPFRDLGLIILTEEHNPHYKSWDQHPKYHARETAKKLAELHNAKMIMQSETPSIENNFSSHLSAGMAHGRSTEGRQFFSFQNGFKFQVPNSKIIDMREEMKAKNYSIFSRELLEELKKYVGKKVSPREISRGQCLPTGKDKKIILFINRRGEASAILCRDCGHIIKCKNCETPMVLHSLPRPVHGSLVRVTPRPSVDGRGVTDNTTINKKQQSLLCHCCGYKKNAPDFCPNCHGHRIKFLGGGTEKVEEELQKIFPEQKILRLDSDTAKTEKMKKDIIKNFNENNGILIGTQLMTSSDISETDFLGIINSDSMLNMPDFRSGERTFQIIISLLQKVKNDGKILYQTYSPDHYAIKYALQNDYKNFYKEELKLRKLFNYPPFSQIIKLTFSHKNKQIAEQEAKRLYEKLTIYGSQSPKTDEQKTTATNTQHTYKSENVGILSTIGPAPAFIPKKRGGYNWHIIIKIPPENQESKNKILRLIPSNWEIDVDPESLL